MFFLIALQQRHLDIYFESEEKIMSNQRLVRFSRKFSFYSHCVLCIVCVMRSELLNTRYIYFLQDKSVLEFIQDPEGTCCYRLYIVSIRRLYLTVDVYERNTRVYEGIRGSSCAVNSIYI